MTFELGALFQNLRTLLIFWSFQPCPEQGLYIEYISNRHFALSTEDPKPVCTAFHGSKEDWRWVSVVLQLLLSALLKIAE
jgi:hypothetical protein